MKNRSPSVNFLRAKEKGFLDKFLSWALTAGRAVIVITETIALAAFIYRFSLDKTLIDLHDEIRRKQAIVSASKVNEARFRNLHERLFAAAKFDNVGKNTLRILEDVYRLVQNGIVINSIVVSKELVKIDANASSIGALKSYVNALRGYEKTSKVSIERIENRTSTATISVVINMYLKQ